MVQNELSTKFNPTNWYGNPKWFLIIINIIIIIIKNAI